jgi:hypothetical protein
MLITKITRKVPLINIPITRWENIAKVKLEKKRSPIRKYLNSIIKLSIKFSNYINYLKKLKNI